jgi:hypothetical protein
MTTYINSDDIKTNDMDTYTKTNDINTYTKTNEIKINIINYQSNCDEFDGLIYHSGKEFIVSYDYAYQSIDKHVFLLCKDVTVIPPVNYIHKKSDKKKCYVKESINLTLLETNMVLSYSNVVFGKKNIKICFGKLLHEELEYQLICSLIKKNACNILALDNLSDNLINEIMKKQFNELDINTDFIIKDNKIIIGINGY